MNYTLYVTKLQAVQNDVPYISELASNGDWAAVSEHVYVTSSDVKRLFDADGVIGAEM